MLSVLQQIGKAEVAVSKPSVVDQIKKEQPLPVIDIHSLFHTKNVQEEAEQIPVPVTEAVPTPSPFAVEKKPEQQHKDVLSQLLPNGNPFKKDVGQGTEAKVAVSPSLNQLFGGQLVVNK